MENGNTKSLRGQESRYETLDRQRIIEVGEVVSVQDPNNLGRIKVRIKGSRARGGDDGISDDELPWCLPLMTKMFSIQPKPKESVFIFTFGSRQDFVDRMYMGPIISQPQQLNHDPYFSSSLAGFSFGSEAPKVDVESIPQLKGIFPNPEDVSVQGRYNTDITQKHNEVLIRAGKFIESTPSKNNPFPFTFNTKSQGYIQIKNGALVTQDPATYGSVTNIVANKINLLTHENGSPFFELNNQENLISNSELAKILTTAHPIGFGDLQLEYMILMKNAIFNHVHNGSGNPATDLTTSGNIQSIAEFKSKADDLERRMLSKNIRIN